MRLRTLFVIVLLVSAGLLLSDLSAAVPLPAPTADVLQVQGEGVQIARRRKKRRRRKKPKPKPAPAPEPEPAAAPEPDPGSAGGGAVPMGPGGRARVDFDAQLIKGQTTKAGEVQILERKDTELKSMVKRRTSFREEIILSVFPEKAGSL